jgi:hypothetical protein
VAIAIKKIAIKKTTAVPRFDFHGHIPPLVHPLSPSYLSHITDIMAKSVRASVSKRNRANLRKTFFGPVNDARTERLAAKLQELADQPRPEKKEMEVESAETGKFVTTPCRGFHSYLLPPTPAKLCPAQNKMLARQLRLAKVC